MRTRYFVILAVLPIFIAILLLFVKREAMKNRLPEILAVLSIFIAIMLLFHQQYSNGFWFNWYDFWHHESVDSMFRFRRDRLVIGQISGEALTIFAMSGDGEF